MCVVGEENKSSLKEWFLSDCVATSSCFLPPHGRTQLLRQDKLSQLCFTLYGSCCFSNPHRTLSENCHFAGEKKRQEGSTCLSKGDFPCRENSRILKPRVLFSVNAPEDQPHHSPPWLSWGRSGEAAVHSLPKAQMMPLSVSSGCPLPQ